MFIKYYGLHFNSDIQSTLPRCEFLSNGLFRITQPKYLNDKGSESRFYPYFNEFSPADLAWAKKRYDEIQSNPNCIPSENELIRLFLMPMGERIGDAFPHMFIGEGDFVSMDEYDKSTFLRVVEELNEFIVEALSSTLGVLSLSKTDTNEHMWNTYASEGKGLAITFNENHIFFKENSIKDVSYLPEKRAAFTYFKGFLRLNGEPLKNFKSSNLSNLHSIFSELKNKNIDIMELTERLMYSKAPHWFYEEEARIVLPLTSCEKTKGKTIYPKFNDKFSRFPFSKDGYPEVCLKKIPFDVFDSIVFGYAMSNEDKESILNIIKGNSQLSHLKIKQAKHDIYGKISTNEIIF